MKAIKLFSMAALAIMMAACSNDLNEITEQPQQPQQAEGIPFKAILPAPGSDAATRTTYGTFGGASGLPVSWRAKDGTYDGDQIALLHNGVKDVATVTAVDASGNATIEAIITGSPADNDDVVLVYPAASVNSTGSGTGFTPDATYAARQLAQDGTLEYIANYLDGREGSGKLSVNSEGASLKSNVSMASKIAIWQFWLKKNPSGDLPAKKVTMKLGGQAIAQAIPAGGTNQFYMCVVPKSLQTLYAAAATASLPTPVFCIEATDGTDSYYYEVSTQLNLAVNTFYQSTGIKMNALNSETIAINNTSGSYAGTNFTVTANKVEDYTAWGMGYSVWVGKESSDNYTATISATSGKTISKVEFTWDDDPSAYDLSGFIASKGTFTYDTSKGYVDGVNATSLTFSCSSSGGLIKSFKIYYKN